MADPKELLREKQREDREKAFSKTVKTFGESVEMSKVANEELEQSGKALKDLKGAWSSEVTDPFKSLVNGFTSAIPGFGIASKLAMIGWKNTLGENAKKKQLAKKEEELLAKNLGLSVEQLRAAQQRADALKAQEEVLKNLNDAASEFGLVAADFDALAEAEKGADVVRDHLNASEEAIVLKQLEIL